ncbi:MAG: hypothetical protein Q4B60_03145 [Erysipelotrichaceae bacterium]|nr:hypothetical protein [Erysipelotrichaceae bacterium]
MLEDFYEDYCIESAIINEAKCLLVNYDKLDDFVVNGISVSVYPYGNGYRLESGEVKLDIKVSDKMITYCSIYS